MFNTLGFPYFSHKTVYHYFKKQKLVFSLFQKMSRDTRIRMPLLETWPKVIINVPRKMVALVFYLH